MVIKTVEENGKIYYRHFDDYDKYIKALKNEKSLS
jgi:hypothetical protein